MGTGNLDRKLPKAQAGQTWIRNPEETLASNRRVSPASHLPLQLGTGDQLLHPCSPHLCLSPWQEQGGEEELKCPRDEPALFGSSSTLAGDSGGKESTCNVGDLGLIPGWGRSPGGGHGNPLQYSCLENPHGQRSLVGYSSWVHKESDTTEQLSQAQQCAYSQNRRIKEKRKSTDVFPMRTSVSQDLS